MPCNSDYLQPTGHELESKRVCSLICYINRSNGQKTPPRIERAAKHCYGDVKNLDQDTACLDALCRAMSVKDKKRIMYDGRDEDARHLAGWWERHQEWDKHREETCQKARRMKRIRDRLMAGFNAEEREALGL